jgi:hypothetical protein
MGALLQVLKIIFEVQRKMNNEKITKKKSFATYKTFLFVCFFFPLSFWTPLTFKPHNFFKFLIHLN